MELNSKKKSSILNFLWFVFILGFFVSLIYGQNVSKDNIWIITDSYIIFFTAFAVYASFYKFKINQYFRTFEGKIFGIILLIASLYFFSEIFFIFLKFIYTFVFQKNIYEVIMTNITIRIFTIVPRILAYLFGIYFLIKLLSSYKLETNWKKQLIWLFLITIIIFFAEYAVIHPILERNEILGTPFLQLLLGSLLFPILNLFFVIIALTLVLFVKDKSTLKIFVFATIAFTIKAVTDLGFLNLIYTGCTTCGLGYLLDFGNVFVFLLIGHAFIKFSFKYLPEQDLKKINLNKPLQQILSYIRFNRNCIKKDITKKFNITRKTTDVKLKILEKQNLIETKKEGREILLSISEKGIEYLNTIE